jgi:apolipoprotein N-acyltransferase
VPQLIRRQINELSRRGEEPDLLINTTNDGWFYGSAILDLHFQGAVLRTIETRKPLVIAANTGISGHIDSSGRIMQRGPNHAAEVIVATVAADGRWAPYRTLGDWPAAACLGVTLLALLSAWRNRSRHGAGRTA